MTSRAPSPSASTAGRPPGRTGRRLPSPSTSAAIGPAVKLPSAGEGHDDAGEAPDRAPGSKAATRSPTPAATAPRHDRPSDWPRSTGRSGARRGARPERPIRPAPTTRISRPASAPDPSADLGSATSASDVAALVPDRALRPAWSASVKSRSTPGRDARRGARLDRFAHLVEDLVLADHDRVAPTRDRDGVPGRGVALRAHARPAGASRPRASVASASFAIVAYASTRWHVSTIRASTRARPAAGRRSASRSGAGTSRAWVTRATTPGSGRARAQPRRTGRSASRRQRSASPAGRQAVAGHRRHEQPVHRPLGGLEEVGGLGAIEPGVGRRRRARGGTAPGSAGSPRSSGSARGPSAPRSGRSRRRSPRPP